MLSFQIFRCISVYPEEKTYKMSYFLSELKYSGCPFLFVCLYSICEYYKKNHIFAILG